MTDAMTTARANAIGPAATAALVEARGLGLRAEGRPLVSALDWRLRAGERWCVIGRNAVGKSTLLRALAGLAVPHRAGEVAWRGRPQRDWPAAEAAQWRAWMPQHTADRFAVTVGRLLELSVVVQREHPREAAAERQSLLQALDIAHLIERPATQLSGGERQRVAIAQCALQGAAVLLMDEPVSFQDPAHQTQVAGWAQAWVRDRPGVGLVMTSHDLHWVGSAATHVLALHGDGRWSAGQTGDMLTRERLREVFDCDWQRAGQSWLPG